MATPRQSGDERFFTPRSTARTGDYVSSEDEREEKFYNPGSTPRGRLHSARSVASDTDYATPRSFRGGGSESDGYHNQESKYNSVPMVSMPFVASPGGGLSESRTRRSSSERSSSNTTSSGNTSSTLNFDDGGYNSSNPQTNGFDDEDLANVFSFARHNRTKDLERLLDESGIPANIRDPYGNTILIVACQNGLKRIAKLALRRGADINARNVRCSLVLSLFLSVQRTHTHTHTQQYKGNTCLHFCFAYGYGDTLGRYLISKGADSNIRNVAGLTCFEGLQRHSPK